MVKKGNRNMKRIPALLSVISLVGISILIYLANQTVIEDKKYQKQSTWERYGYKDLPIGKIIETTDLPHTFFPKTRIKTDGNKGIVVDGTHSCLIGKDAILRIQCRGYDYIYVKGIKGTKELRVYDL